MKAFSWKTTKLMYSHNFIIATLKRRFGWEQSG